LSEQIFSNLQYKPKLRTTTTRLSAANGSTIRSLGEAEFIFTYNYNKFTTKFIIVEELGSGCLVGIDTLKEMKAIIYTDSGLVKTLFDYTDFPAMTKRQIKIAPHTQKICMVQSKMRLPTDIITIEGVNPNFQVLPTCISVLNSDLIPVLVQNPSDSELIIPRGTHLADIAPFTEEGTETVPHEYFINTISHKLNKQITDKDVNLHGVPITLRQKYLELLNNYSDIFSVNPNDVGLCTTLPQKISLLDHNKITNIPPRRYPHHLLPVVDEYVDTLLEAGIIQRSTSPFSSPLMLVKKAVKPGESPEQFAQRPLVEQFRVVHDFRSLNSNTIKDSYPMRNLNEMIDDVAKGKVWSIIDLSNAFWSQSLHPDSQPFTAFGVPGKGHFEYTRSAQGLCNSPASFQRMLDFVLRDIPRVHVYIDDVVLADADHCQHLKTLEAVFQRFCKYGLKCRVAKLQLATAEVNYLGFNISKEHGIRAGEAKIQAIKNWQPPTSVKEVKQFLGLCSFFRRTIPNFSSIASPLNKLTRKDCTWNSGRLPSEALQSFEILKQKLCTRPALRPVDFNKEFNLTVDASSTGYGAILSQTHQGIDYPCAYASTTVDAEKNPSSATLSEFRAILWACQHFKPYLWGKHFTIFTDHKPLLGLNKMQTTSLEKLRADLDDFQPYTLRYLKGENMPSDGLSRQKSGTADNPHRNSNPSFTSIKPTLPTPSMNAQIHEAITIDTLNWENIHKMQLDDNFCKNIVIFKQFNRLPNFPEYRKRTLKHSKSLRIREGVLCKQFGNNFKPVAPEGLRHTLLQICHDQPHSGHFSFQKTLAKLLEQWWWPGIHNDTKIYCHNCHQCALVNLPHNTKPAPLLPRKYPEHFSDTIAADLLGPLPQSTAGNKYLLVVTDAYSKWVELIPLKNKTAEHTAIRLYECWIAVHGCFNTLITDQGFEFNNKVMRALQERFGFKHILTSVAHPQGNGLVENHNRMILNYFRKHLHGTNFWEELLPSVKLSYNTSIHSSTHHTPFFLTYNRCPLLPHHIKGAPQFVNPTPRDLTDRLRTLSNTQQSMQAIFAESFRTQKEQFDKRSHEKKITPGDRIYVLRPHSGPQLQKFQVIYKQRAVHCFKGL